MPKDLETFSFCQKSLDVGLLHAAFMVAWIVQKPWHGSKLYA